MYLFLLVACTAEYVPGVGLSKKCDEEFESLRISFFETVNGYRVSTLSMCIFLGYEFDVMAICAFK